MSINSVDPYKNPLNEIDPSRNNVNKIMNPSIRYFPENDQNVGKRAAVPADRTAVQAADAGKAVQKRPADRKINAPAQAEPDFKLEFTSSNIMNGFILSELLGKPKVLQKRRWY